MKPIKVTRWQNGLGLTVEFTDEVMLGKTACLQNEQVVQLIKDLQKPGKAKVFKGPVGMGSAGTKEDKAVAKVLVDGMK